MEFIFCEVELKNNVDTVIALVALAVSVIALTLSIYYWRRQFRPIVTAAVRTKMAGLECIAYNLVLLNSGSIPARNIRLNVDESTLEDALGKDATKENKKRWLACFSNTQQITVLHNGAITSCSFGTTRLNDQGFWKVRGKITITIVYEGWFGKYYQESQTLEIVDSASFTGYSWGNGTS
ncbi:MULTISPECIES: hypothetical protein [Aeromonas]|uniref:hypothetical protein n=1 Tax=Aeromonas caviae TaxID=648 RepID=UPI002B241513|nr:hypothetical protein [Aeromonas caviae]MEA9423183.1 hypothetical protein [Aeromonas caviae]MEA9426882.1 hypothetical protein [Aeromonas caviae]MEA9430030.1 hypothetical protein [Aeromonas caviae]